MKHKAAEPIDNPPPLQLQPLARVVRRYEGGSAVGQNIPEILHVLVAQGRLARATDKWIFVFSDQTITRYSRETREYVSHLEYQHTIEDATVHTWHSELLFTCRDRRESRFATFVGTTQSNALESIQGDAIVTGLQGNMAFMETRGFAPLPLHGFQLNCETRKMVPFSKDGFVTHCTSAYYATSRLSEAELKPGETRYMTVCMHKPQRSAVDCLHFEFCGERFVSFLFPGPTTTTWNYTLVVRNVDTWEIHGQTHVSSRPSKFAWIHSSLFMMCGIHVCMFVVPHETTECVLAHTPLIKDLAVIVTTYVGDMHLCWSWTEPDIWQYRCEFHQGWFWLSYQNRGKDTLTMLRINLWDNVTYKFETSTRGWADLTEHVDAFPLVCMTKTLLQTDL